MSLSAKIAPHLPFLRRFARAASGSQSSGDALVAAVLEAIIADTSIFPEASNERIALYRLFAKLFMSISIRVPHEQPSSAWEQRASANLSSLAPRPRQAFLLVAVEGFTDEEAAEILDVDRQRVRGADRPGERRDFAPGGDRRADHRRRTVDRDGHRGDGREPRPSRRRHRPHPCRGHRAVQQGAPEDGAGRHPVGGRQFRHRRGQRDTVVDARPGDLHHRLPGTAVDRANARSRHSWSPSRSIPRWSRR